MKERPILFSGPQVRAILEGRKTQTRRMIRLPKHEHVTMDDIRPDGKRWPVVVDKYNNWNDMPCPYGQPGDRLWVRETWRPVMESYRSYIEYQAGGEKELLGKDIDALTKIKKIALRFPGASKERNSEVWHPSNRMPRWASRITLEVVSVRVERLQDISDADATAEGCERSAMKVASGFMREVFRGVWTHINGADSWADNPWVWVVEFKRTEVRR